MCLKSRLFVELTFKYVKINVVCEREEYFTQAKILRKNGQRDAGDPWTKNIRFMKSFL